MKRNTRPLVAGLAAVAFSLACLVAVRTVAKQPKPPKKKILIKGCKRKKKPVLFDHPGHVKLLKKLGRSCRSCHHLVKGKPAKKNRCSACHMKKQGTLKTCQASSRKKNPFHRQCVGCHKKMRRAPHNKKKGPTKCKQCHK